MSDRRVCPCGIDPRDCDYHGKREHEAQQSFQRTIDALKALMEAIEACNRSLERR